MKLLRFLQAILILISCFTLSSCEGLQNTGILKEGSYATSYMVSGYRMELNNIEYVQINCNVKRVTEQEYNNSTENNFVIKSGLTTNYYDVKFYLRKDGMSEFVTLTLTDITENVNEYNVVYYTGNITYYIDGVMIEDEFEINISTGEYFHIKTSEFQDVLYYESYKLDIKQYNPKVLVYQMKVNVKSRITIKEISKDEFKIRNINQFQSQYGGQYLEVILEIGYDTNEFERVNLNFKNYHVKYYHNNRPYYSGDGYMIIDDIKYEFEFELYLEDEGYSEFVMTMLDDYNEIRFKYDEKVN